MNGYVEKDNQKYLWIGKRSKVKSTYPGKLDHLVAGGLVWLDLSPSFFKIWFLCSLGIRT